jgi:hypothetical protein
MKIVINIVLILISAVLAYLIALNIKEPITFDNALKEREGAVVKQLTKIRTAQEIYKKITGEYAGSFDTLQMVLRESNIETYKIIGDLDDENSKAEIETIYTKASDSMRSLNISIDSLDFVPYGDSDAEYTIKADTLTYQNTLVNVVEVGIPYKKFMDKYADPRYQKYNSTYEPENMLKFGDLFSPNTSGNWKK